MRPRTFLSTKATTFCVGLALSTLAPAALTVTDGTFSNPAVANGATNTNITNWFDEAGGNNFSSFIFHSTAEFGAGSDQLMAFGPGGGYLYQSLGTRAAGEEVLSVVLDAYERPNNTRHFPTLTIDFYGGTFTGANGTDIGATLASLGTLTVSGSDMFTTPVDGSDGESVTAFTVPGSVDVSAQPVGTEIWMRMTSDANGNPTAVYIDNLGVTATPVPEPSAFALAGLAALALLRRRR